ncbi:PspC domain-containing protein [Lentilactobacillus sunkii]|uniref:Phage shock protein C, PspC n=1 Tax=Lentilactobacillus sunkii DSM 19904 TaxID=1423808 RepID=A0A0R1L2H6_9LACO|nr:PspC domain-containing protein [Lentilactobacillus sunkii]KRK90031.1 phage shock protein C, PspC [Lentilactobacillus sunkii DSM 19904]
MNKNKKLRRSATNRVISGVLGGISNYFGWNSTLVRILYVILAFTPAIDVVAIIAYIIMMFTIPLDNPGVGSPFDQLKSTFTGGTSTDKSRKVIHDVEEKDVHDDQKRGQ